MENIPLQPGETITKRYRQHPIALIANFLLAAAAAAGAAIAMWVWIYVHDVSFAAGFMALSLFLVFVAGVILLIAWATYTRTELALTNYNLYYLQQRTLFSQRLTSIPMTDVDNARGTRDGVLQTALNFGTISVQVPGGTIDYLSFYPVGGPEYVAQAINAAARLAKQTGAAAPAATPPATA